MNKRVFITGGASGLGRALAFYCAEAGYKILIGDLHEQRGEETALELSERGACEAVFLKLDVRSESDLEKAAEFLQTRWGGVDVVVNNAGVAQAGKIEDVPLEDWEWVLDINLLGVVRGCKIFTPLFKTQGHGHFVNVASMAGLLEGPELTAYSVTKAGVIKLSEMLDQELQHQNIKVSVVCPAFFPTNLGESLRTTSPGKGEALRLAFKLSPLTCEQVAHQVFMAIQSPRFWVLPHRRERFMWLLKSYLPQAYYRVLAFWLLKLYDRMGKQ